MKRNKFWTMSENDLAAYQPKSQDECEARAEELEFRQWCKKCEIDPEDESSREHYREATGKSFWEDVDDDDAAGWVDNMTKD
jgi:hypothetical protein